MEKKNKSVLILSLLLVLSITSIGFKNGTSATPLIPTPDPPNGNIYWDFDAGTFIGWKLGYYNGTTLMTGFEMIYNISALTYFNNYSGTSIDYYGVQLRQAHFNATTSSLEEYPTSTYSYPVLNCSMANFTSGEFMGTSSMGISYLIANPFIPINGSDGLMTEWCANGLADDYANFLGGDLTPNITFPNTNTIIFENSTGSGDYVKLIYYDNGTLETAELTIYGGYTFNYTRFFDFNPIDEVEWNVEIGDEFYFGFRHFEYKYVIVGFVNHSGYGLYGLTAYQSVIADLYRWNSLTETWILQSEDFPIASANNELSYLTTTTMDTGIGGPQLFVPNGTTVDDMLPYFDYMISMYPRPDIELEYGADYIKLFNSTSQEYIFYAEFTSEGVIKYIINKLIVMLSDPYAMVYYYMNSEVISGMHNFNIVPYGTTDFQVAADITVSEDTHLLYAGMDYNPTNKTLPNTCLVLNVFINESSNLVGNLNMTITYDHLKYDSLEVWGFNYAADGGSGAWEKIDFIQPANGTIIISVDHLSLFALVEAGASEPAPEESIPFGNFYILFMIFSIIGLIVYSKRKI